MRATAARLALLAALVVTLLLPGAALAADPAPSPAPGPSPATPILGLTGGGIVGGSGPAWLVPTVTDGWAAVLDRWSGADYEPLYLKSFEDALWTAAARIARTGKPVGIIVGGGTHAWVLHGFVAPANPALGPTTISAVFVSGPLYAPRGRSYDPAPDTRLSVSELRRAWRALGAGYDNAGTWVVVAPIR